MRTALRLAEELGMLDAPAEQIVDSTPMLGAAATQDTVRLVRHGVKKLIDAVAAVDEQAARSLVDGLEFDYEKPVEKPDCRWRVKAERERMLTRVAQDAERALRAVEQAEGCSRTRRSPRRIGVVARADRPGLRCRRRWGAAACIAVPGGSDHLDGRSGDAPRAQVRVPAV